MYIINYIQKHEKPIFYTNNIEIANEEELNKQ